MIIKYIIEKFGINNEIKNLIVMSMILIIVIFKFFDKENYVLNINIVIFVLIFFKIFWIWIFWLNVFKNILINIIMIKDGNIIFKVVVIDFLIFFCW